MDEIADAINNTDMYKKEDIIKNFEHEMKKLKEREKNCDIKISDYIEENYRWKQLFYDPNHPTNDVIKEKAIRVLDILNIKSNDKIYTNMGVRYRGIIYIWMCKTCTEIRV